MKKTILIAAALLAVFTAKADQQSEAVLKRMAQTFAGYGNYEVKFTVNVKGAGSFGGNYFVSGDKYHIAVQKAEQFSDGKSRYSIYPDDKEVVVDKEDKSSHNILNNPTKAFDFLPSEFSSVWKGARTVKGKQVNIIVLTPRDAKNSGVITLYVSGANGMPVAVDYDLQGEQVSITIDKITPLTTVNGAMFIFDKNKYKGYEVIDFR